MKNSHSKALNCLVTEIIHHLKHIGRLVYYFAMINEDPSPKNPGNYKKQKIFLKKQEKSEEFVNQQMVKFFQWKLKRWNLESKQLRNLQKLAEIIITCKICLNKVPSSSMNSHSSYCLKRAEALHDLKVMMKTTNKYIAMVCEIKQFLITKTKLDM